MKSKVHIGLIFFGVFFIPQLLGAQIDFNKTPDDDLGNAQDTFQEYFFEALKQKGIENYQKAVNALEKCLTQDNTKAIVYFELGKNYAQLKNFGASEQALDRAISMEPENEWYRVELYKVYLQQKDTKKAIKTIEQLVEYHPKYKDDLAVLYVNNKEYKEALKLLDYLDETKGITPERDRLRNEVYAATGQKKKQIKNLEERLENNPENEENYLKLIYRYSENNNKEMAYQTALKLLEVHPESEIVHLALYKFYLEDNKTDLAVESMKIALQSLQVNPKSKLMVVSDFLKFVEENPQYEETLVEATGILSNNDAPETYSQLAHYFLKKGNKENALRYFEEALKIEPTNFDFLKNILLLHIDLKQFTQAKEKAENALNSYPSQPILYLIHGVALNHLKQGKQAIETLETGFDYIIENPKMEMDFYKQLSIAYTLENNNDKAKAFLDKAKQLEASN